MSGRVDRDPNRGNRRVPLSTVSAADLLGLNDDPPAPSPAAAGLPAEDVERVARAIEDACTDDATWRTLAAAALAEMRPTAAEEAVWEAETRGYERGRRDFQFAPEGDNHHNAALCPYCSPAPVPHDADGGERR